MSPRLVIAAGGTGGHLFPAMRLARYLHDKLPGLEILFMGSGLESSPLFDRESFSYCDIPSAPWRGIGPLSLWRLCHGNSRGFLAANKRMKAFDPSAVIGFGSYHTLPVMAATWMRRCPLFLYEANTVPGKVNKLFSRYATTTAVQFPLVGDIMKGALLPVAIRRLRELPNPELKARARHHYGLDPHLPTILIAGGSQGALVVNDAAIKALTPPPFPLQVLHLTGSRAPLESYRSVYSESGVTAAILPFEPEMELAWAAADLFVGRAGAGTIAELLEAEVPALLIPYPWSRDHHQEKNGEFFEGVVGGGGLLPQSSALVERLRRSITAAFADEGAQLKTWRSSIHGYTAQRQGLPTLEEASLHFLISRH